MKEFMFENCCAKDLFSEISIIEGKLDTKFGAFLGLTRTGAGSELDNNPFFAQVTPPNLILIFDLQSTFTCF